jgi:hypothetical protein
MNAMKQDILAPGATPEPTSEPTKASSPAPAETTPAAPTAVSQDKAAQP